MHDIEKKLTWMGRELGGGEWEGSCKAEVGKYGMEEKEKRDCSMTSDDKTIQNKKEDNN